MQLSNEIIKVLEYLGEKIGITIDWTSNNAIPYLEQLCGKFIKWEIGTSIGWIVFMFILVIIEISFASVKSLIKDFSSSFVSGGYSLISLKEESLVISWYIENSSTSLINR